MAANTTTPSTPLRMLPLVGEGKDASCHTAKTNSFSSSYSREFYRHGCVARSGVYGEFREGKCEGGREGFFEEREDIGGKDESVNKNWNGIQS